MSRFRSASLLAASSLTLLVSFAPPAVASPDEIAGTCADVDVVVVRGTSEPSGSSLNLDGSTDRNNPTGVYGLIKQEMTNPTDGSTAMVPGVAQPGKLGQIVRTDISYPATIPDPFNPFGAYKDFKLSVRSGTTGLVNYTRAQITRCPDKRFVYLGFSQGSLVVANAITANADRIFYQQEQHNPELTTAEKAKVVAVAMFADPGFRSPETIPGSATNALNVMTAGPLISWPDNYQHGLPDDTNRGKHAGSFVQGSVGFSMRNEHALEQTHFGKVRSYCLWNDPICQAGSGGLWEHLHYAGDIPAHRNLAQFVVGQLRNRVDKTIPVSCTVSQHTTYPGLVGTQIDGTIRVKATVNDRVRLSQGTTTSTVSGISTSLAFDAADANTVRATLLANSTSAEATLNSLAMISSGATASQRLATGTSGGSVALQAGQPWTSAFTSTSSVTFNTANVGTVDLRFGTYTATLRGTTPGAGGSPISVRMTCAAVKAVQNPFGRIIVS